MSSPVVTKSVTPPSHDVQASSVLPDIVIGPDILELLSNAMYIDPMTIYREYVQNAADAIDEARNTGILAQDQHGQVNISIDAQTRSVRIRDNGCGVPSEDFGRRLLAIGGSNKRGSTARGFRGVGRLAGLGYAREVVFRTSAAGESTTSELRWDCRQLKAALLAAGNIGTAVDVIRSVTSLEQECGTDTAEHFFEVELKGVIRLSKDQLTSTAAVGAYLSQVAPVPFAPNFRFAAEITEVMSRHMCSDTLLIHINDTAEPIYRPHQDRITCDDKRQVVFDSIDVMELTGIDGNVAAVVWILHHDYEGAIPAATMVKGLRLRSGNIQVGGYALLEDLFPEPRFNAWTVGEVHVLDRRIVPNGRRDHFEQNTHYNNLLNHLTPTVRAIARRCRASSVRRKWERELESHARVAEEKLAIVEQGSIGKAERKRLALEVEKALLRMGNLIDSKIHDERADGYATRTISLHARLSSLSNDKAIATSPLARLPDRKRRIYEQFFELIYACSSNRIAAKSLVDRILMRLA